jgi:hypothetical protein
MRREAFSIANNIAEGFGRFGKKIKPDFINFPVEVPMNSSIHYIFVTPLAILILKLKNHYVIL